MKNKKVLFAIIAAVIVIVVILICLTTCHKNDEPADTTANTEEEATTLDLGTQKVKYFMNLFAEKKIAIPMDSTKTTVETVETTYSIAISDNYARIDYPGNYSEIIVEENDVYSHLVHGKFIDSDPADSWCKAKNVSEDNLMNLQNFLDGYKRTMPTLNDDGSNIVGVSYLETVEENGKTLDRYSAKVTTVDEENVDLDIYFCDADKTVTKVCFNNVNGEVTENVTVEFSTVKAEYTIPTENVYPVNIDQHLEAVAITLTLKVIE